ncbi:MAG: TonB family protein [Pseudomonadales bacterium]|nr:TonB family protein [Pseudomonadales bacterium]
MKIIRFTIAAFLALIVTSALLLVMQQLIHNDITLDEKKTRKIADIQMGETQIDTQLAERKPDKPEDAEEQPPELQPQDLQDIDVNTDAVNVNPSLAADLNFAKGPGLSASDGEYLPMVKVQAQYPRRALSRGIEGYCIVMYTVTKTGATKDTKALDCSPKGVFERASIKAAAKFKYKPRIEDGIAIEVPGVRNKFTYRLAE